MFLISFSFCRNGGHSLLPLSKKPSNMIFFNNNILFVGKFFCGGGGQLAIMNTPWMTYKTPTLRKGVAPHNCTQRNSKLHKLQTNYSFIVLPPCYPPFYLTFGGPQTKPIGSIRGGVVVSFVYMLVSSLGENFRRGGGSSLLDAIVRGFPFTLYCDLSVIFCLNKTWHSTDI